MIPSQDGIHQLCTQHVRIFQEVRNKLQSKRVVIVVISYIITVWMAGTEHLYIIISQEQIHR
jgi:hypothetical protein